MRYTQAYDGEWVRPSRRHYYIQCCDCKLAHRIDFRVRARHVEFRAFRLRRRREALQAGRRRALNA